MMLFVFDRTRSKMDEKVAYGLFSAGAEGILKGGAARKGGDGCHGWKEDGGVGDK